MMVEVLSLALMVSYTGRPGMRDNQSWLKTSLPTAVRFFVLIRMGRYRMTTHIRALRSILTDIATLSDLPGSREPGVCTLQSTGQAVYRAAGMS